MHTAVSNQETVSPTRWIDWALELNSLWQDLKMELTKAEIMYNQELAMEMIGDTSKAKAEIIAKSRAGQDGKMSAYELYQYLVGRDKIVKEFIMLAKRRATIEEVF